MTEQTTTRPPLGETSDGRAEVTDLFATSHPPSEGFSLSPGNLLAKACGLGRSVLENFVDHTQQLTHELMHGDYSEKFKREFDENRVELICEDGTPKTARIFNREFLGNDLPAIVYTFSLAVPGAHGVELGTLADIVQLGEETGQSVVAITTDGQAGKTSLRQQQQLTNFMNLVKHNFDVLRQVLPRDKRLSIAGASLGGMMAHGMAMTAEEEALHSGHPLYVENIISVASAGHDTYGLGGRLAALKQFTLDEGRSAISYVHQGEGWRQKIQRGFELIGTSPRHMSQLGSIACIAHGIMKGPLKGGLTRIPHETRVFDITFDHDGVTQPEHRSKLWEEANHPKAIHIPEEGDHLDLLTRGRELTLACLWEVAPPKIGQRLRIA